MFDNGIGKTISTLIFFYIGVLFDRFKVLPVEDTIRMETNLKSHTLSYFFIPTFSILSRPMPLGAYFINYKNQTVREPQWKY